MRARPALLASLTIAAMAVGPLADTRTARADTGLAARGAVPVVFTGAQLPQWSRVPAEGVANPYPSGALDQTRDAHNGMLTVPPDPAGRTGVPAGQIAAYAWRDGAFREIPVQVDQRFPYFLANGRSDFGIYSGTDEELTYQWDVEAWKKTAGECSAQYAADASAMQDPVATLDDDDEIALSYGDAGQQAPSGAQGPPHTGSDRQELAIADPLNPGDVRYVYLFLQPGGSSFTAATGPVQYARDANADEWVDRYSFLPDDPEKIAASNTGYGPNLSGTVCRTAPGSASEGYPQVPDGQPRDSTDRVPRDGVTVTTPFYRWHASGRWMIRQMQVAKPGQPGTYGPDLIDRWKGRAFQQSPDSGVSLVGFEDEQVNWEANSALLGERAGPVRAIREVWGADSGTNVTKTETFYADAITYRYHLRVHPIPPDGLYTSWDYNHGVAADYYNAVHTEGIAIDGLNDDQGNIDGIGSFPAYFDVPDPTFGVPVSVDNWEQVSGRSDAGSMVYVLELKGPTSAENPTVVPYYRDDKCLDDGTGDDPIPRPWPGEASTDPRVQEGYSAANGGTPYAQLTCDQKQGAWGQHGVHFLFTNDTDNGFGPKPTTEVDAQQWAFAVPTSQPHAVGDPYANAVRAPVVVAATDQANTPAVITQVAYTGDTAGRIGDAVTMTAQLTDDAGRPVSGRQVRFTFQGRDLTATTDQDGTAAASTTLSAPAGAKEVTVAFAGDAPYLPSTGHGSIAVQRRSTRVTISVPPRKAISETTGTMTATLVDPRTGAALPGRTVRFTVNGASWASATTGSDGVATAPAATTWTTGTRIAAEFAGDDTFSPVSVEVRYSRTKGASGTATSP